jgi:hypothetical protein
VEGGATGTGNLAQDPQFSNAAAGDYSLKPTSPCIDKGGSSGLSSIDLTGGPRIKGAGVDMGAYEVK